MSFSLLLFSPCILFYWGYSPLLRLTTRLNVVPYLNNMLGLVVG